MVKLLKTFETLDFKDIDTLMASKLKLQCDPTLEIVDVTFYG